MRPIHLRLGVGPRDVVSNVSHNADHGHGIAAQQEARAHRPAFGPVATRQRLADDDRRGTLFLIRHIEDTAFADRNPKRLEVVVRDARVDHDTILRVVDTLQAIGISPRIDGRSLVRDGDVQDARKVPQTLDQLRVKPPTRLKGRVVPRQQLSGGREDAGGVEAERRSRHLPQASSQKTRAGEKRRAKGHLRRHERAANLSRSSARGGRARVLAKRRLRIDATDRVRGQHAQTHAGDK